MDENLSSRAGFQGDFYGQAHEYHFSQLLGEKPQNEAPSNNFLRGKAGNKNTKVRLPLIKGLLRYYYPPLSLNNPLITPYFLGGGLLGGGSLDSQD